MSSPLIIINHNELISAVAERMTNKKLENYSLLKMAKLLE